MEAHAFYYSLPRNKNKAHNRDVQLMFLTIQHLSAPPRVFQLFMQFLCAKTLEKYQLIKWREGNAILDEYRSETPPQSLERPNIKAGLNKTFNLTHFTTSNQYHKNNKLITTNIMLLKILYKQIYFQLCGDDSCLHFSSHISLYMFMNGLSEQQVESHDSGTSL